MGIRTERIGSGLVGAQGRISVGRAATLLVAFLVAVSLGYVGYQRFAVPASPAPIFQLVPVSRGTISATVVTTGSVVPTRKSQITFGTSGTITQVDAGLGDKVKAGQVLARLDSSTLENKLAQARSSLRSAEIKLEQLKVGATPAEIAAAEAALSSALAKYDDVASGPKESEIKSAEQAVTSAEANLTKARADLATLKAGPSEDELLVLKADLEKKQAALVKAQSDYDKVSWRGDIAARAEAMALQQATIDYQVAQANYSIKTVAPKPDDLVLAEKAVESATAALASAQAKLGLLKAGPAEADLQSARASVASARSQLALKKSSSTELDLVSAQEQINQAQLSVRQAEIDLSKAALVAPFDGVVSAVNLNVGEQTSNQAQVTIVDTSAVRVDVAVDEADLSKLSVGKPAQFSFDALPDTRLTGKVIAISPNATVQQGVVTYVASLQVDSPGVFLPAGMTASVSIIVDQRDNVLLVPNRAVRTQGRSRIVEVMANGKPEIRTVTVGLSNDQMTEVSDGVREGEQVVIPTTTTARPTVGGFGGGFGGPAPGGNMMVIPRK